ncbi:uncharacterized protein PV09_07047 [Verruconis gallopava]|uniref:Conserved oligomeric Golgi complex subunit 2 n=1 Tax=Verruconis gallopava TaxID=253628 RepID=A0A0D2A454_9PEZI|nr:uncharacterized protein PV09_07047 [Verruconis gallopava]KIW01573.1 hypothetical protein PV09_07047 [Verruconis gallopava]
MSGFYVDTPSNMSDDERSQDHGGRGADLANTSDDDDFDDDDLSSLPYPQPLPRSAFLSQDFKASEYLSTLRNRHQTLSDLRAELRARSQMLSKELLDLVNNEYQAFLGLGGDLRGGEEKVEAVRVGVLGFVKGVDGVKSAVKARKDEVDALLAEKKRTAEQIAIGRRLVEIHTRIGELEHALALAVPAKETRKGGHDEDAGEDEDSESEDEDDDDEEDEDGEDIVGVPRLERLVMTYLVVLQMIEQVGPDHPFLVKQQVRLDKIRETLLLDLSTALKQAKAAGAKGKAKLLRVVALYGELSEGREAIRVLKETKTQG